MSESKSGSGAGRLFYIVGVVALVWLADVIYMPYQKGELKPDSRAAQDVQRKLFSTFPSAEIRLDVRGGNNLHIYVSIHDFERVAYPDRKGFVAEVGAAWCDQVDQTSLPSVEFRDIRSGKTLAMYSCILGHASLE